MRNLFYITLLFILLLLDSSCTTQSEAGNYIDRLDRYVNKAYVLYDSCSLRYFKWDYRKMDGNRRKMSAAIAACVDSVNNTGNIHDGNELKQAAVNLLDTLQSIMNNELKKLIDDRIAECKSSELALRTGVFDNYKVMPYEERNALFEVPFNKQSEVRKKFEATKGTLAKEYNIIILHNIRF